jgi:hypothetical protein
VPLSLASFIPPGIVIALVAGITLFYFAAVDFLYVGRLAAYAAVAQWPDEFPVLATNSLPPPVSAPPRDDPGQIDKDELILSDLPLQEPGLS